MMSLAFIGQVEGWWDSLDLARQIFYGIGVVAGIVSLVLGLLSFIGLEHHDAIDAADAMDLDHGGGGIFSIKPLTGFFLGFGWCGGLALESGLPIIVALIVALAAGISIMMLIVWMFRAIYRLRSDGTVRIEEALGAIGTVYVTLPPHQAVGGQVIVNFSGRQETLTGLSRANAAIPSGEKVRVVQVLDSRTVLVEPL